MARRGDPNLNSIEDVLIAFAFRPRPDMGDMGLPNQIEQNLRALLRSFPNAQVETFIGQAQRALALYLCLAVHCGGRRQHLRKKLNRIALALDEAAAAVLDMHPAELELAARFGRFEPPLVSDDIPADGPPAFSAQGRFAIRMTTLAAGAGAAAEMLRGTAQDRSRPLRFLITSLFQAWIENTTWPRPVWRGDIDPTDPEMGGDDLFCEVVRLVLAALANIRTETGKLLALRPDPGQIEHVLRSVIVPRTRGRKKMSR
jgi:hypothetical protein